VVTLGRHQKTDNCLLAESFASLQPMKALNEDKSISVAPNKDWGFLPNLQHALGDLADNLRPECGPSLHRDIDFGDWEAFALEHGPHLLGRDPDDQYTEKCWRHEDATGASARSRWPHQFFASGHRFWRKADHTQNGIAGGRKA
jgi:hypothetical protein